MALSGGFTPQRSGRVRLPRLEEDWRTQPENIDPKTGQPVKRRKARQMMATTLPGGGRAAGASPRNTSNVPGQSTQGVAPGGATPRAANPSQAVQIPGQPRTTTGPSGSGMAPGAPIAATSTIPGPLGTLEPHGQMAAAQDPTGRTMYGQFGLPGGSAGRAAGFYGSAFNPQALLAASGYGGLAQSNESYLQAGQALAEQFTGGAGAGKFLDPVQMMQNITGYAQKVMDAVRGGEDVWEGGPLALIADMDPPEALDAFLKIVKGALVSVMPEAMANAYVSMLEREAYEGYIDPYMQNPIENDTMPGAGVIAFLAKQLGPTMGLQGGNAGGVGTTLDQFRGAFGG